MSQEIYALFEYYGDEYMSPLNYLCIKHGEPDEILNWLLNFGYLNEVYQMGQMMGVMGDEEYLDMIAALNEVEEPTVDTIRSIDICLPSCCTCRAVSESFEDFPAFLKKFNKLLDDPDIGTVLEEGELSDLLEAMENASKSEEAYQELADLLPYRYI